MKTTLKNSLFALALVGASLITAPLLAQPAHRDPRPGKPIQGMQPLTTYTGTMGEWLTNDNKIYNGFTLKANSALLTVRFPAHMGTQVTNALKPGSSVTVNGIQEVNPMGVPEVHLVSLVAGNRTLNDTSPTPPAVPVVAQGLTVNAKITDFKRGMDGQVNGLFLSDNTILNFPPHSGYPVSTQLKVGDEVQAYGFLKPQAEGEVMAGDFRIIHAQTITIHGNSYLLR